MTADSGEALRSLLVSMNEWLGNDKGLMNEDVVEWRDQLAAALLTEEGAQEPPKPNQHALTIYFGRFLTEQEWRAVVDAVRAYVPFEHLLEANAITSSEARDSRPAPPLGLRVRIQYKDLYDQTVEGEKTKPESVGEILIAVQKQIRAALPAKET